MNNISLRAYHQEIDRLIEGGNLDDAILQCQHILKTFPMNLDTYRLLGKSYLEGKNYDSAADIFQRLLMSLPDDFVSHVGMSIIRDNENNLDDSIWHMERAFEVQPSNPAIQEELKKLYGRRDGKEPSKIRLTRDALANMYTQGALYSQAIAEISSVLAEDPDRQDLKVMLARAYNKDGRKKQAVDTCTELLKKSPYCFDALKILVSLLSSEESQQLVSKYRSRLFALDPYIEHSTAEDLDTINVPDNSIMLEKLETGSDFPAKDLDSKIPAESPESFHPIETKQEKIQEERVQKDMDEKSEQSDEFDLEHIKPNIGTEIPDWIKELAPENLESANESENIVSSSDASLLFEEERAEPEQAAQPVSSVEPDEYESDDIPSWLREMGTDELFIAEDKGETEKEVGVAEIRDEETIESEIPSWMTDDLEEPVSRDEQASEAGDEELPDWLIGIESEKENEDLMTVDGFDPVLHPSDKDEINFDSTLETEPTFDTSLFEERLGSDSILASDKLIEGEIEEVSEEESVQAEMMEETISADLGIEESSIEEHEEIAYSSVDQESSQSDQIGDLSDADAAFAWLESLAARQGANPNELVTHPGEKAVEPPDWIKDAMDAETPSGSFEPKEVEDQLVSSSVEAQIDMEEEELEVGQVEGEPLIAEELIGELPDEVVSELEKGSMQAEMVDQLEQNFESQSNVKPEDEFIFEKEKLIINENSVDEAQETGELEELAPSISSNEFEKNDYELEEPEISAQAESTEQPEVKTVEEEAVEGMEKISMRGEWKPLEESTEISEPEAIKEASPEEIPFEAEVSQQERVPAGGPLTKVPAREIEKEAEVLEKAQQLLNQRDLKKSLDEYQKLIKKGKLLEGVIHDLREISYQYPVDVSVWQSLGDAYMKANQLQDALESYTKAEELLR